MSGLRGKQEEQRAPRACPRNLRIQRARTSAAPTYSAPARTWTAARAEVALGCGRMMDRMWSSPTPVSVISGSLRSAMGEELMVSVADTNTPALLRPTSSSVGLPSTRVEGMPK